VRIQLAKRPDNIRSISEVVGPIPLGSHIALGAFSIAYKAIATVHELMPQQKRDLALPQRVVSLDTDLLVGARLVTHLIMGGGSPDRFGPVHCVNRARATGSPVYQDLDAKIHSACVASQHSGDRLEQLKENTGFPLHIPKEMCFTPLPTAAELRLLREEIDPKRVYLQWPNATSPRP